MANGIICRWGWFHVHLSTRIRILPWATKTHMICFMVSIEGLIYCSIKTRERVFETWMIIPKPSKYMGKKKQFAKLCPFLFPNKFPVFGEATFDQRSRASPTAIVADLGSLAATSWGEGAVSGSARGKGGIDCSAVDTPKTTSESVKNWENWANPKKDISSKALLYVSGAKS